MVGGHCFPGGSVCFGVLPCCNSTGCSVPGLVAAGGSRYGGWGGCSYPGCSVAVGVAEVCNPSSSFGRGSSPGGPVCVWVPRR